MPQLTELQLRGEHLIGGVIATIDQIGVVVLARHMQRDRPLLMKRGQKRPSVGADHHNTITRSRTDSPRAAWQHSLAEHRATKDRRSRTKRAATERLAPRRPLMRMLVAASTPGITRILGLQELLIQQVPAIGQPVHKTHRRSPPRVEYLQ